MKIYENGIYRDMTQEEIDEINKYQQSQQPQEPPVPTIEDRVASMEEVILNLI